MHDLRDVGGTSGGLPHFLLGVGLLVVGGYLFMDRITVSGGYFSYFGSASSSFGITLIPVLIGIGLLFYDGASIFGWVLSVGGLGVILAGVIANLRIHFQSTGLVETLIMLGMTAAGLGLVFRSLRPVKAR